MRRLSLISRASGRCGADVRAAVGAAPSTDDELLKDEKHFLEQSNKTYNGGNKGGSVWNMVAVGHNTLGDRGFNGDVWYHKGYAYVGHWGFADWAGRERGCFCPEPPKNGVAVLDVRDPARPTVVSKPRTRGHPGRGCRRLHREIRTPLDGETAAAGIQYCGGSRFDTNANRGLMLWDVTNPAMPVQIGYWRNACCTRGVHEFEIQHRADLGRTAYATVPTSRYPDAATPSGYRDENGDGDFRLIDITDPAHPWQVSDWGIQDVGGPFSAGQGCDADANYGHGAEPSDDGKLVFLSYWDSGFIRLDLTNPSTPKFTGRTVYPVNADGDAHSSQYDDARALSSRRTRLLQGVWIRHREGGFGYMRVYDYSNPSAPRQIGEFRSANSLGTNDQAAGDFVLHNNFLVGTTVYQSWYSDGVRVVDARTRRIRRRSPTSCRRRATTL